MLAYKIITYLSITSVLIPLGIGIHKLSTRPLFFKGLVVYLLISGLSDIVGITYPEFSHVKSNIFGVTQIVILTTLYVILISNKTTKKRMIGMGILLLLCVYLFERLGNFQERNMPIRLLSGFWFIMLAIHYYITLFRGLPVANIVRYPYFWFNLAILVYFSGNLFLYASITFVKSENLYYLYIPIHSLFNVTKNLFLARSLYLDPNVKQ